MYLLLGLLALAAIPVVATVRILDQNAVRNARARADAALRLELEAGIRRLGQLSEDASAEAADLVRSPAIAHSFIVRDKDAIAAIARKHPTLVFSLEGKTVAGRRPGAALTRTVWLTVNGNRIGSLVGTVALDQRVGARLLRAAPHDPADRLLLVRSGSVIGTKQRFELEHETVRLRDQVYRALFTPVPNGHGVRLLALRPVAAINASVHPYRQRIRYAALGSFAMLVLLSFLFARPILRALSDFRRVASQATTDALTGLANRRSFDEELALEWRRAERVGSSLALILADIDNFKDINDTYGHQVGDTVLAKIGEALSARVRQYDFAARYGGEEFAILLPETDIAGARTMAQRLRRDLLKARIPVPGGELGVTASFGVSASGGLDGPEQMIAAADAALYDAKKRGKNRVASRRATAAATA